MPFEGDREYWLGPLILSQTKINPTIRDTKQTVSTLMISHLAILTFVISCSKRCSLVPLLIAPWAIPRP